MGRKIFGIEFVDFFNIPLSRRIQTFAVMQWNFTFLFLGLTCLTFCILMLFTPLFYLVLLYIPWYVYDYRTPERGGRRVEWVRRWSLWNYYRNYFPISLVKTAELSPDRNYLCVYHPHGILVHGAFCNFGTEATSFSTMFPGIRATLLSLKYQFLFPINREYVMSLGVASCSKSSMDWLLSRQGTGNAILLVVGGASEALEARPGSTTLTLARRKGFARMALEHGVPLVPVYGFGETEVYNQVPNPPGSRLRRFQTTMMKWLTFSPPLYHGRGIFNYTFGWMPFRKPITVVVGSPIEVELTRNASEEQVDALHQKYIACLNDLFETHKDKYGIKESQHLHFV